ncbi:MAG: hypothetical protein RJA70_1359 [Pseudomonadota bacterium]
MVAFKQHHRYARTMPERVKLIWDFFGPHAQRTAEHQRTHLSEFAKKEQLRTQLTGAEEFADGHWLAWLVVESEDVDSLRATLRPQRGLPA